MGSGPSKKKKKTRRIKTWLRRRNTKAEEIMEEARIHQEREVKLLILGTGDSGKSTFIKQIQILYKEGFSDPERRVYKNVIRFNLVAHIKTLITATLALGMELQPENLDLAADFVENAEVVKGVLHSDTAEQIAALWDDSALKEAFERRAEFQIADSASYFLDKHQAITHEDYQPTDMDILSCRIATVGVKVLHFNIGEIPWKIVDVGGQRSERRKWLHQFDDVTTVIYVMALSEYDQQLYEDESVNRMQESLSVFDKTLNNQYFKGKNCVLLFNKIDLFHEKIEKSDIRMCFQDYDGGPDPEVAKEFIRDKFVARVQNSRRNVFTAYTCGTRTEDIRIVFESVEKAVADQVGRDVVDV